MSFPPSSFIGDMEIHLEIAAVESAVLTLRPELAGCVRTPEAGRPLLSFDVSDDQPVAVGLVRGSARAGSSWQAWMIDDGRPGNRAGFWFLGTRPAVLAEAVVAWVDAAVSGRDPASPWRWGETLTSPLTKLADALTERGALVTAVVAHNRCIASFDGPDLGLRHVPDSAGQFLQVLRDDPKAALQVALRPTLGWTLERTLAEHAARLDPGQLLTGTTTLSPGVRQDDTDIEQLADAVIRVLD
jgi:hypothetical protein